MRAATIAMIVAFLVVQAEGRLLRHQDDPLAAPDNTGYDPVELLCTHKGKIQGWCQDWVSCIKTKAVPAGTQESVRAAWQPADCKEVCGEWPATTPAEGGASLLARKSNITASQAAEAQMLGLKAQATMKDCQASCTKFQDSLSSCVAKLLFEPGQVATMGMPSGKKKPAPEFCTKKDTSCLPDLPIRVQKCQSHETRKVLYNEAIPDDKKRECTLLKSDLEDCKDCPQLQDNYGSQYTTFVGGCMDQLNAYWQATNPTAKVHAIAGATGCKVH